MEEEKTKQIGETPSTSDTPQKIPSRNAITKKNKGVIIQGLGH